ncbi:low temperature requirement protein A [Microbacterium sp. NEAU-LLB]|uniref:Low temperature requirement protein A n=2 Tax=Microbacterium stercoris TaxID=2820289 RepID=A0A939QLY5_9MICO|nr:low temperature requirement protein A [Microbacterium stercoris]
MVGRDIGERHRAATPLELLFDLTFVVAFSQAGSQAAHLLELGHWGAAITGFVLGVFGVIWAWINYTWLASAFDNDDLWFRLATFVQMVGVILLALGIPALFHSIDEGHHLDNVLLVAGYIVMRIAGIALWLRVARQDPAHRGAALRYAGLVGLMQIGWIVLLVIDPPLVVAVTLFVVLGGLEMLVPMTAEGGGRSTPWHPHHIAERYSLLTIITLGEVVLGTVLSVSAVVEEEGWSLVAGVVAFGGTALAFGLWWVYFMMPSAQVLSVRRERSFAWGYGHIAIFASIAATGAGLHVAAYAIRDEAHIDDIAALLTVAIPVGVFVVALYVIYTVLLRAFDPFHLLLFGGTVLVLIAAVAAVALGAPLSLGIGIVALAPIVSVIGYETVGHRHQAALLEELRA